MCTYWNVFQTWNFLWFQIFFKSGFNNSLECLIIPDLEFFLVSKFSTCGFLYLWLKYSNFSGKTAEPGNIPPPLIGADELCLPRDQFLENDANNYFLDFNQISCQYPIILEILRNHPLHVCFERRSRCPGALRTIALTHFIVRQGEQNWHITFYRESRQLQYPTHPFLVHTDLISTRGEHASKPVAEHRTTTQIWSSTWRQRALHRRTPTWLYTGATPTR